MSGIARGQESDVLVIERSWDFGIGVGYGELSNPFLASDDVPAYLTFDIAWYGKRFFFDNGTVGYTVVDRPNLGVQLIANYSSDRIYHSFFNTIGVRFAGVDFSPAPPPVIGPIDDLGPPDNPNIVPLEVPDRDFTINMGIEFLYAGAWGQLQASVTSDVLSKHDGQEAVVTLSKGWRFGRFGVAGSLGAVWKSDDLVDYYYGLQPEDNPGVGFSYRGRAALNPTGALSLSYQLKPHIRLVGQVSYEQLDEGITDSLLIVEDDTRSVFVGVFYHF